MHFPVPCSLSSQQEQVISQPVSMAAELIFPAVCGAPSGTSSLLCSEPYGAVAQWLLSFKAVPARQEDTQGFHQDAGEAGLVDAA